METHRRAADLLGTLDQLDAVIGQRRLLGHLGRDHPGDAVDAVVGPGGIVGAHAVHQDDVERAAAAGLHQVGDAGEGRAVAHDDGLDGRGGAGGQQAGDQQGQQELRSVPHRFSPRRRRPERSADGLDYSEAGGGRRGNSMAG
jgi:hypothetical protein